MRMIEALEQRLLLAVTQLTPAASVFDGTKQTWVSAVGYGHTNFENYDAGQFLFGDEFPLDLVYDNSAGNTIDPNIDPSSYKSGSNYGINEVDRLTASGITGLQTCVFPPPQPLPPNQTFAYENALVTYFMQSAKSAVNQNFKVAPTLDGLTSSSESYVEQYVEQYVNWVKASNNDQYAGKVNGAYIVYNFNGPALSASQWSSITTKVAGDGYNVFWINDAGSALYTPGSMNSYLVPPVFNAQWSFNNNPFDNGQGGYTDAKWNTLISTMNNTSGYSNRFSGGIIPSYDRETASNGGWADAHGTYSYRHGWELAIASGVQWNNVITWDDSVERHDIRPSSNWNWTRSDLTAYYSAKMGAAPMPTRLAGQANLYVTTPQWIQIGSYNTPDAEGMVINDTNSAVTVNIQLVDGAGTNWGSSYSQSVPAHSVGAVTIPSSVTVTTLPAGRFLRAKATMGTQSVTSAPICIYDASTTVPNITWRQINGVNEPRILYFSIPAYKALSGTVGVTMAGNPLTDTNASVTVTPPSGTNVRFVDVMQNSREVWNMFKHKAGIPYTTAIPIPAGRVEDSQTITTSESGFYVARVIDSNEKVAYADPVYIGPSVAGVMVNDGNVQRSMVSRMTVTFNQPVSLSPNAIVLQQHGGGAVPNVSVGTPTNPSLDGKTYVITFSGAAVVGSSLPDGMYDLRVIAQLMRDGSGNTMAADSTFTFHRLYGDINGDKTVDLTDSRLFRLALAGSYDSAFDVNGDGFVDLMDSREFRLRIGVLMVY